LTLSTYSCEEPILPSDWISQAEAAQLRGVSRQAISKLVRQGRLSSIVVGGHTLVSRAEVLAFQRHAAGRRKNKPAE
jgi:excisionase family DNA binding protein